ncbi:hypothetical protein AgCh_018068 [Apium graveolens]
MVEPYQQVFTWGKWGRALRFRVMDFISTKSGVSGRVAPAQPYYIGPNGLEVPLKRLFVVTDDIFCLFQGHIENVAHLKQKYGLGKNVNEVIIILEAYITLRDRGPYPADLCFKESKRGGSELPKQKGP